LIIRLAPAIIASQELTMFLRRHHRTVAGKELTYYTLVESVRTEAGPRQRTVAHLGELNAAEESRWQRTVAFHNRQGVVQPLRLFPDDDPVPLPDDPAIVRIRLDTVGWTNARRFGDIWLAWQLWRRLKLDEIVDRHVPQGKHTVLPATVVAIEVINRLCAPCSEFALAEHWYASTGLEDLLGVSDEDVTKDRLYRTLDDLLKAQEPIENELKQQFGALFHITYDLMLYDLTSTYFEGLAEENDLARRGYSRDHRSDCKQVVLALIVTREGFPLAHYTLAGNVKDVQTVKKVVQAVEKRFGAAQRVWVMDRGMISKKTLAFLAKSPRKYLLATLRKEVARFQNYLGRKWQRLEEHRDIEVQPIKRGGLTYLLVRSKGTRHAAPTTARLGPGLAPTARADRRGPPQEPRQDPRTPRPTQGQVPQGDSLRHADRLQEGACPAGRLLEHRQVQSRPGARRRLPAAQQSARLVRCGVLGNVHATDRRRGLPSTLHLKRQLLLEQLPRV
jgi:hypothetical protein